jgi:preprotein translocase subunit SecA
MFRVSDAMQYRSVGGSTLREGAIAPYPERDAPLLTGLDRWAADLAGRLSVPFIPRHRGARLAQTVSNLARSFNALSDAALREAATDLRPALLRQGPHWEAIRRAFALTHAAVERHLGLRYHPTQLAGGLGMLRRRVVEMATGEGKTITAMLPSVIFALAGRPVHVVTVNDYLAGRDAERLRPVFSAVGLSVGLIQEGMPPADRRRQYAADVTYVTNKELGFDYLRDRVATTGRRGAERRAVAALRGPEAPDGLCLSGLHVAIVDEADSVLIDEARTPLIISADRDDPDARATMLAALDVAATLRRREHFTIERAERATRLTPDGEAATMRASESFPGRLRAREARLQLVTQALNALHLYDRDKHYIVVDGKIHIVDEYTGRTMPDRTWEAGLHQLIEAKEGLELTGDRATLARITYQRLFNRYLHLCGMTGTAAEMAGELHAVYGLRVQRIPTNRPVIRRFHGTSVSRDASRKWAQVADRAEAMRAQGRPVLIGTQSVAASEALSAVLEARGTRHVVLNARQDADEAAIIARAGQPGVVTVATNIAGRGTDIVPTRDVAARGGLHVILTGFHESPRIDRQLYGRAGRQGDPGSCEAIVALDDELFARFAPASVRLFGGVAAGGGISGRLAGLLLRRRAQVAATRLFATMRGHQIELDRRTDTGLGFAGRE